jgi:hypothetical protein
MVDGNEHEHEQWFDVLRVGAHWRTQVDRQAFDRRAFNRETRHGEAFDREKVHCIAREILDRRNGAFHGSQARGAQVDGSQVDRSQIAGAQAEQHVSSSARRRHEQRWNAARRWRRWRKRLSGAILELKTRKPRV